MKTALIILCAVMIVGTVGASPMRIVLLDCEDQTDTRPDTPVLRGVTSKALANKAGNLVGKHVVGSDMFTLIDRRDFTSKVSAAQNDKQLGNVDASKLFIHAARALDADGVLRSSILAFSTSTRTVDQGGHKTQLATLSVRIMLEVLDVTGGAVVAMSDGIAQQEFRITSNDLSQIGEEDALKLLETAIANAMEPMAKSVGKYAARRAGKKKVSISIKTSADPAIVEVDGVMIGSTPLIDYEVYSGDHIVTIGKPGYQDLSKRILIEKDSSITVPLLRNEFTMEELKEIITKMRVHRVSILEPGWVIREL